MSNALAVPTVLETIRNWFNDVRTVWNYAVFTGGIDTQHLNSRLYFAQTLFSPTHSHSHSPVSPIVSLWTESLNRMRPVAGAQASSSSGPRRRAALLASPGEGTTPPIARNLFGAGEDLPISEALVRVVTSNPPNLHPIQSEPGVRIKMKKNKKAQAQQQPAPAMSKREGKRPIIPNEPPAPLPATPQPQVFSPETTAPLQNTWTMPPWSPASSSSEQQTLSPPAAGDPVVPTAVLVELAVVAPESAGTVEESEQDRLQRHRILDAEHILYMRYHVFAPPEQFNTIFNDRILTMRSTAEQIQVLTNTMNQIRDHDIPLQYPGAYPYGSDIPGAWPERVEHRTYGLPVDMFYRTRYETNMDRLNKRIIQLKNIEKRDKGRGPSKK
jgi:hypothetical protein